ncbi:MAG: N-6 DNA methylase [Minwuia sp.]|nr:N-6 DNA methylase [Minwuia sp.]
MAQTKEAKTWEFGDFQTPTSLAEQAIAHLREVDPGFRPRTIIEPTCGVGAFLLAAADAYPEAERLVGLEIEAEYLNAVRSKVATRRDAHRFELREADFFKTDWDSFLADLPKPVLVVGNPPWVTNADIGRLKGSNLPEKSNFQKYTGLEAVTGKANFDISEWILIQNLRWISEHNGCLAMLCKTAVARKILRHAWKEGVPTTGSRMVQIDAMKNFSAAVDACFFSVKTNGRQTSTICEIFADFEGTKATNIFGYHEGMMLSHVDAFNEHKGFLGKDKHYTWRSGLKHDNSKVMELRKTHDGLKNGHGDLVEIEDLCTFPLLKSSDLGNRRITATRLEVIVTQRKVGQPTGYIQSDAPLTWRYLESHAAALDGRRSSIYRNKPRFSIFGVGDYTFTDWKVAISGFYKRLEFQIVGPIEGKPVVFDDTVYFLSAKSKSEAIFLAELLNSQPCQDFLESMVFWSDKRPITVELLKRVDLERVADSLGRGTEYRRFTQSETATTASHAEKPQVAYSV